MDYPNARRKRIAVPWSPGSIGDVWNIIDIHAHASLLDSLPNALLEAMSLGKASVVTSVGGIPEAIKHKANGFLVKAGNAEELARYLSRLVDEPRLRNRLGKAAQMTYRERVRPELMARQLEECFYDVSA
jgi:glycosyltransferase involved in cell wall biosynthesis